MTNNLLFVHFKLDYERWNLTVNLTSPTFFILVSALKCYILFKKKEWKLI